MRAALLVIMLALPGCNTVGGVGRDITQGADAVSGWFR